ncbi:MAG TPA: 3-oxoacyl-[acyl-carrier-protein] synthase III C-terminal domain-containing protein [Candidatus Eisenbacteria bacterium]|jgi:3-oxoacyl-[acyl-carrier-protein] synthase-3|nr:3-oxoacyl-[acyl-carrier-protein] synthase III C-terminal domain-containing protein [Candidatus Eisenbacteria bacterium]
MPDRRIPATLTRAIVVSSYVVCGANTIASEEVDAAFGMPIGKLRNRAGIVSLAYAAPGETEATLGARAAEGALRSAGLEPSGLDWLLAATETHHAFPSLAAQIHRAIGARENCGAMDIGGACLGFVNALAVAKALVESAQAGAVLVATADVHSRTLRPGRTAGEFGGLFGDGASAFVVCSEMPGAARGNFRPRDFFFGCASQYQQAIQVSADPNDELKVVFDGDALSRAATARLEECIMELEQRSGVQRGEVAAFATHQPNPRLVRLLAKRAGLPAEKFPLVADTRGNLGSTTCAAALHYALERSRSEKASLPQPIFLASLGPGLLFGGGWLEPVIPRGDPS